MKRFRFNLEKLLELRRYEEQSWEIRLGQIISRCTAEEHKIRDMRGESVRSLRSYSLKGGGMEVLKAAEAYRQRMASGIRESEIILEGLRKEKAEIQKKFIEVSNRRKVLDRLKEKEEAAYYREQASVETKELDDINIGVALRKRGRDKQTA